MALPRPFLANRSAGPFFTTLEERDLQKTNAVIGPAQSVPDDIAVFADYTGKLLADSGYSIADLLGGGMVPTFIAADEIFTVPANKQALFATTIDVEGLLVLDGILIGVD